ncbi:hypothetical protein [Desulfovibrio sp. JC010]|uniref:hypothetical protein n=1 Tax=Desulfovibrio sp. JC010 TaxID=2593641 RepID=UPI0013D80817|nr:hypothetical protein [Desulfovibrio sp. JC010]NDV27413.1 hypothetical protein [Desulfovibrio sp. JC010]
MKKNLFSIIIICLACSLLLTISPEKALAEDSKSCPWRIAQIGVGKWGNGKQKATLWIKGSFPILPKSSERPVWYINDRYAGHAQNFFNDKALHNGAHLLSPGQNTIKVQFNKPPYAGTSSTKTISNFSWDGIGPGGYKWFH